MTEPNVWENTPPVFFVDESSVECPESIDRWAASTLSASAR
jgi:hypothetical protein